MTQVETLKQDVPIEALEAEVLARRVRLMDNLDNLSEQMRPSNLLAELKEAAWAEVDRVTDELANVASNVAQDGIDWVNENRSLAVGGLLTGLAAGAVYYYANRKRPVPLYDAYSMEDPSYLGDLAGEGRVARTWSAVKGEAQALGEKAESAYYAARSKASVAAEAAREQAAHAADIARERASYAADSAREQAAVAKEAAAEAAHKAKVAAADAGRWVKKQPQENPGAVIIGALAAGALIGLLMPGKGER